MPKKLLDSNVYEAAIERIKFTFDNFEKVYNVNVNCGSGCNNSNQTPDVIVPVYSPWRTYYPYSWIYPYNWNYPYYWSQYNFW